MREKQPLTFMARSAIESGRGQNLVGYNDYRGVPVIGAWNWLSDHGFGITTEIDVAEAYQAMQITRNLFRALSTFTGLLILFLTGFFLRNRSQIASALSEQKRLAETIKLSARTIEEARVQLDAVFQNSPLGLILFDSSGTIANCNDRFVELMGSTREQLLGFNTLEDASDPAVREGLRKALNGEWADYEGKYTSATAGKTIDLRIIYNPVNPDVTPTEVIASLEDITFRREAEERLEAVSESAPDAIVTADDTGTIIGWNRAAETILGWTSEEIVGQNIVVITPDRYEMDHNRGFEAAMESGESRLLGTPRELAAIHKDGREIEVDITLSIWTVGSKHYSTGILRDITERKKMERELVDAREAAESANRAKSAFLANMSHELRTPMNAIIGYTEMLQEEAEDLDEEDDFFTDDLKKIHGAGKHLLSLINDVLDLSKIESGKMELYNETFELAPLTEDIASTIHSLIEKNQNKLVVELDPKAGEMHADITKIRQSVFNLLSNAAKFTTEGTITLSVDRLTEEGVDWISFAVADTGIGVAADKLDKLFEEFSQADESTTRQYGGTGLGLAITKRFCEMMGGSIGVTSELGVGTTFTIRLPAVVESKKVDQVAASQEAVKAELGDVEAGATVLVIDDDETARELLQRTLERDGYQVVLAADGEEGLELARQIKPAVITLDVMMPKMDGWAVLKALKEDEVLRDIPVIMVTIVSDKEMMFALGAVEHLTKPVDRDALRSLIEKYMVTDANRALIIEDDEPSRSMLRRTLEELQWDVAEAENGKEGLELLDGERPDLILLDLMMPVMDGFEFVEEVRRREDLHSIPIIVVSAKDLTAKDRERLQGAVEIILEKSEQTTEQLLRQISDITKP
jgi:PAS domain S-box-containing protein